MSEYNTRVVTDAFFSTAAGEAFGAATSHITGSALTASANTATRAAISSYLVEIGRASQAAQVDQLLSPIDLTRYNKKTTDQIREQSVRVGKLADFGASSFVSSIFGLADLEDAFEKQDPRKATEVVFSTVGSIIGGGTGSFLFNAPGGFLGSMAGAEAGSYVATSLLSDQIQYDFGVATLELYSHIREEGIAGFTVEDVADSVGAALAALDSTLNDGIAAIERINELFHSSVEYAEDVIDQFTTSTADFLSQFTSRPTARIDISELDFANSNLTSSVTVIESAVGIHEFTIYGDLSYVIESTFTSGPLNGAVATAWSDRTVVTEYGLPVDDAPGIGYVPAGSVSHADPSGGVITFFGGFDTETVQYNNPDGSITRTTRVGDSIIEMDIDPATGNIIDSRSVDILDHVPPSSGWFDQVVSDLDIVEQRASARDVINDTFNLIEQVPELIQIADASSNGGFGREIPRSLEAASEIWGSIGGRASYTADLIAD